MSHDECERVSVTAAGALQVAVCNTLSGEKICPDYSACRSFREAKNSQHTSQVYDAALGDQRQYC